MAFGGRHGPLPKFGIINPLPAHFHDLIQHVIIKLSSIHSSPQNGVSPLSKILLLISPESMWSSYKDVDNPILQRVLKPYSFVYFFSSFSLFIFADEVHLGRLYFRLGFWNVSSRPCFFPSALSQSHMYCRGVGVEYM